MAIWRIAEVKSCLVSVIVPTYNGEKVISRIIKSVLEQPYRNIELIVVNDGSDDATADVVGEFIKKDKRVLMLTQANAGVSAARNAGIGVARGDYLMFFDADDDIDSEMIGKMADALSAHRTSIIVCGKSINDRSLLPEKSGMVKENVEAHVADSVLKNGLLYSPCNKIYVADVIKKNKILFNVKVNYGEDLIFNLAYLKLVDSIFYIRKPLYKYQYSSDGTSAKNAASGAYRRIMYRALESYMGENLKDLRIRARLLLIKMRWGVSVYKAKLAGRRHG